MFVVLASATGAPGVSTTALGLALSCESGGVLYVEADPRRWIALAQRLFQVLPRIRTRLAAADH